MTKDNNIDNNSDNSLSNDRDQDTPKPAEEFQSLYESDDGVSFGVSSELRDAIEVALENHNTDRINELMQTLLPVDVADLINHLHPKYRTALLGYILSQLDPEVLVDVDPSVRVNLIKSMSVTHIARLLLHLDSDDAMNLLESMDSERVHEVLRKIPLAQRSSFERVLQYPEKSAGRLMQREMVCVPEHWTVGQVVDHIRAHGDLPNFFYDVYVVDPRHHYVGKIPINQLVRYRRDELITTLIIRDSQAFPDRADQEDVAQAFRHYALVSAPVTSPSGRVIGMITVDDIVDVLHEEVEEDILHMNKVSGESDFYTSIPKTAYWRTRWLLITLVNTLIASYVISQFEASIQQITALSFLMTINAAMGGNAGMQVVTVVVRALATRDLREDDTGKAVRKELGVSLMAGGFCSILLGIIAGFWVDSFALGAILSTSLLCNMLWAALAGTLLPVIVTRFKLDPAISAGPILTTTTDVFGYALFLGLATLFLL